MSVERNIAEIIEPSLEDMGFELVRVQILNQNKQILQIMAERADGTEMNVDHCADISHTVSMLLDVEDPLTGEYTLEVSSPGIDRPLTRIKDYQNYVGFEAKIELARPLNGRRRFRGTLNGIENEMVSITVDTKEYNLSFHDIDHAKLVMTDALMKQAMKAQSASEKIETT